LSRDRGQAGVSRWRRLARLSWSDRWILLQAFVWLPLTGAALRLCGFAGLHALLSRLPPGRMKQSEPSLRLEHARTVARLVRAASAHGFYHPTCLPQSLVLWSILRRQGTKATLHAGVRKTTQQVEAHAWVACDGVALNDDEDAHERFAPFDRALAR
jgi:hypothetical protein